MTVYSSRLCLREFRPDDFDGVHAYASDPACVHHMTFGPNTPEQTRRFLEEQCPAEREENPRMHYSMAVTLPETDQVIGGVSFHLNGWYRDDAIIGCVLTPAYRGHGYMGEALRAAIQYMFEKVGLHRVNALCSVHNPQVIALLERTGMRREGLLVQRGHSRPGEAERWFDQYTYAVLKTEWAFDPAVTYGAE